MSFFYDLNKKLNGIGNEQDQIAKEVAKAAEKSPVRKSLEESLRSDMKALMEDGTGGANFSGSGSLEEKSTGDYSAKKAKAGKDIGKPGKNFAKIAKGAAERYGSKERGEKVAGAVLSKLRAKGMEEDGGSEMECNTPTPSKGIPGNIPVPGKMDRLKGKRDYYETDDSEEDIMDYLNRKLAPHDKQQAREDAISNPYNGSAGDADAYNGMEFEGNAFTGKLKSTPKGGKFKVGGEEYTDTSELDETMTRQHFQHTADLLKHIEDPAKRMELAKHHAGVFKASNPRFDHAKFMKACGVDEGVVGQTVGTLAGGALGGPVGAAIGGAIGNNLTDESEVDEGFAEMDRWLAQREKETKGTGKFDKRKVSTGTVYTRKPETFDEPEARDDDTPDVKRGRGRPAGTKGATGARGPTGKSKLMAKGSMREAETDEGWRGGLSGERDLVKTRKPAAGSSPQEQAYNELGAFLGAAKIRGLIDPHYIDQITKLVKQLKPTAELDEKAVSKKQQKFMGMVHAAQKGEKAASPEVAKVAKGMTKKAATDFASTKHKGLPEKVKTKKTEEGAKPDFLDMDKDGDKKEPMKKAVKDKAEKKVDETTTSGSVATATAAPKSSKSGMTFGGGIYDSWNRTIENMISESVNVNTTASKNEEGQDHESITITVDGDDVSRFKELLQSMGVPQSHAHDSESHSDESCGSCGGVPCQCDEISDMEEGNEFGGELAKARAQHKDSFEVDGKEYPVTEADAPVDENSPDYPSNQEESDDALQYSGGLNGPKSTGQTTIPVVASQEDRLHTMEESVDSFLNLYQKFKTK